jgi:hypothetical protein
LIIESHGALENTQTNTYKDFGTSLNYP